MQKYLILTGANDITMGGKVYRADDVIYLDPDMDETKALIENKQITPIQ